MFAVQGYLMTLVAGKILGNSDTVSRFLRPKRIFLTRFGVFNGSSAILQFIAQQVLKALETVAPDGRHGFTREPISIINLISSILGRNLSVCPDRLLYSILV